MTQKIDQRDQVWAITEYFSRDRLEKSAASLGMALSALEEEDIYHFTQRLLIEAQKFKKDPEVAELIIRLKKAYYGNGELPSTEQKPVPLYYLRASTQSPGGEVRIRGIYVDGYLTEVLTWEIWQQLKIQSIQNVLEISSELISKIEEKLEINESIIDIIDLAKKNANEIIQAWFDLDINDIVIREELGKKTNLQESMNDYRTRVVESPDPEKRFRVFEGDYFYNLQSLVSNALNTTTFKDTLVAMERVAGYLLTDFEGHFNGKYFVIRVKDKEPLKKFMELIYVYRGLNAISEKLELTSKERILIEQALFYSRHALEIVITRVFAICTKVIGMRPRTKNDSWVEVEL